MALSLLPCTWIASGPYNWLVPTCSAVTHLSDSNCLAQLSYLLVVAPFFLLSHDVFDHSWSVTKHFNGILKGLVQLCWGLLKLKGIPNTCVVSHKHLRFSLTRCSVESRQGKLSRFVQHRLTHPKEAPLKVEAEWS